MPAFVIGEFEVSEEHRKDFEIKFLTQAHHELEDAGAKIVAGGFDNAVSLAGIPPKNRYVVIQFGNMEAWKNGGKDHLAHLPEKNSNNTAVQAGVLSPPKVCRNNHRQYRP
jgi:hypothetical protein